jgi:hypothetical protein
MTTTRITAAEFGESMTVGRILTVERSGYPDRQDMIEVEVSTPEQIAFRLLNPRRGRFYHVFPAGATYTRIDGTPGSMVAWK